MCSLRRVLSSSLLSRRSPIVPAHEFTRSLCNKRPPTAFATLLDGLGPLVRDEQRMLGQLHECLRTLDVSRDALDLVADTQARIDVSKPHHSLLNSIPPSTPLSSPH